MYKDFGKDEIAVIIFTGISAIIYRILEICKIRMISPKTAMIILMISAAYLFFNRVVKFLMIAAVNMNDLFDTVFVIQDIVYKHIGRRGYNVYIVNYNDADNNSHTKEIHSSFSIRKWKVGDEIKIKVSNCDPDTIFIVFSDTAMAVIVSIIGILFEVILYAVYIHID